MKHVLLFCAAILLSFNSFAQVEENSQYIEIGDKKKKANSDIETFTSGNSHHGFMIGFDFRYGLVEDKGAVLSTFKVAYILNHSFEIGFAGVGIYSDLDIENTGFFNDPALTGGYGGIHLNPIISPNKKVHIAFPTLIGAGAVGYTNWRLSFDEDEWDPIFVFEPGVAVEFNIAKFFRIELLGQYRLSSKIKLEDSGIDRINGFSGGIGFKFGRF
jgi:hypothetical protein